MLPGRWKVFRLMCLFQMALAGLSAGHGLVFFFFTGSLFRLLDVICFTAIFLFAYLGQSLINYNYPDVTPQGRQKKYFNILYIVNFFLLSFIGAHLYNERWVVFIVIENEVNFLTGLLIMLAFIVYALIFALQLYLLYGMFRLRRELYRNFTRNIDEMAG